MGGSVVRPYIFACAILSGEENILWLFNNKIDVKLFKSQYLNLIEEGFY